jgi:hypothetical protein
MGPGGGLPTRGGRLQSRGSFLERWIAFQSRLDAAQEPFQHGDMQPGCLRIVSLRGRLLRAHVVVQKEVFAK